MTLKNVSKTSGRETKLPEKNDPLLIVLGNQLFPKDCLKKLKFSSVYMAEDYELCTYEKFHKHKIIMFLSAMRNYADELQKLGKDVYYEYIEKNDLPYEARLLKYLQNKNISDVVIHEIEDKFFEKRLLETFQKNNISCDILPSPMFYCSRDDFKKYLGSKNKPFMKSFYEHMRRERKVLLTAKKTPLGDKYSFDSENRKKLPKKIELPSELSFDYGENEKEVILAVDNFFSEHPGDSDNFWLATTRKQALEVLDKFITTRLINFGPYQDAMSTRGDTLFHSVVSPYLNCGLLTPKEVVDKVCKRAGSSGVPEFYSSIEGFVRQVLGWREFVRGIYQNYSDQQEKSNFFNHQRELKACWYTGETGILPLDLAIKKAVKTGYSHHIERLMILGNLMVLCEIKPTSSHRWFMEMYVDSSDWVMGPNVYGMALFSDGGIFATKPYICGANYVKKMSDYPKGSWEEEMTSLYWRFVGKNIEYLQKNVRCTMMARIYQKFSEEKKEQLHALGDEVIGRITS